MAKFIDLTVENTHYNTLVYDDYWYLFYNACKLNDLNNAIKYFNEIQNIDINDYGCLFCDVCIAGHIHIVKWLYYTNTNITQYYVELAFNETCKHSHIYIALWFAETFTQYNFNIHTIILIAFDIDNDAIVKSIISKFPQVKTLINPKTTFINACRNNNSYIVEWCCTNFTIDNTIVLQAFNDACITAKFKVITVLLNIYPYISNQSFTVLFLQILRHQKINVADFIFDIIKKKHHYYMNQIEDVRVVTLFYDMCSKNNVDAVKWIFKVVPKIFTEKTMDIAFNQFSNKPNYSNMIELFQFINPKYIHCFWGTVYSEQIIITLDPEQKEKEKEEDKYTCCICFYNQINAQTNCGHLFCIDCLNSHRRYNNTCPMCRTFISKCSTVLFKSI